MGEVGARGPSWLVCVHAPAPGSACSLGSEIKATPGLQGQLSHQEDSRSNHSFIVTVADRNVYKAEGKEQGGSDCPQDTAEH